MPPADHTRPLLADPLPDPSRPHSRGPSTLSNRWQNALTRVRQLRQDPPLTSSEPAPHVGLGNEDLWKKGSEDDPFTKDLLIFHGKCKKPFNEKLLPKLPLWRKHTENWLFKAISCVLRDCNPFGSVWVTEFNFEEEDDAGRTSNKYARLISLNWWYTALFGAFVTAALTISDFVNNVTYCFNIFGDMLHDSSQLSSKVTFVALFVTCTIAEVYTARVLADQSLAAKKDSGDILPSSNARWGDKNRVARTSWSHLRVAQVFFFYSQMPMMIIDIPIWLHPFKGFQTHVALKCDGTRVHAVGFQSYNQFATDDRMGFHKLFAHVLFSRLVLSGYKIIIGYLNRQWNTLWLSLAGALSLAKTIYDFKCYTKCRADYQTALLMDMQKSVILKGEVTKLPSPRTQNKEFQALREKCNQAMKDKSDVIGLPTLVNWKKQFPEWTNFSNYSWFRDSFSSRFRMFILITFMIAIILNGVIRVSLDSVWCGDPQQTPAFWHSDKSMVAGGGHYTCCLRRLLDIRDETVEGRRAWLGLPGADDVVYARIYTPRSSPRGSASDAELLSLSRRVDIEGDPASHRNSIARLLRALDSEKSTDASAGDKDEKGKAAEKMYWAVEDEKLPTKMLASNLGPDPAYEGMPKSLKGDASSSAADKVKLVLMQHGIPPTNMALIADIAALVEK